jgi:hypothetical protein
MRTNRLLAAVFAGLLAFACLMASDGRGYASASQVYKCKTAEGRILYSEKPCDGAPMKPLMSSGTLDFRKMSLRDANTAHDCIEAWENLSDPDNKTRVRLSKNDHPRILAEFQNLCPKFGFHLPVGPATHSANGSQAEQLLEILRDRYPNTPSFTRVYSGGDRNPALFTGY